MKSLIIVPMLFVISICSFAQKNSVNDLIGKWENTDAKGNKGGLEFRDESNAVMLTANGVTHTCKYTIDFTKDPIWFDIIVYLADGSQKTMTGLLEIIDHSTLKWKLSKNNKRFGNFVKNDGEDFILLHRKE